MIWRLGVRRLFVLLGERLQELGEVGRDGWFGDVVVPGDLAQGVAELSRGELGRCCLGDQGRHCFADVWGVTHS